MSIDWFTFTAQIVNFLILIWLLKRFLYGPILRAMAEREAQIAARVAAAEDAQTRAEASEREFQRQCEELEQSKESVMARATKDAELWRSEQLNRAKGDVDDDRRQWQRELHRSKQAIIRELQLDVAQHALELGRHVLLELSGERLQERMVDRFLRSLGEFDSQALKSNDRTSASQAWLVESSHELTEGDRQRIRVALEPFHLDITFRTNPQLICGIELHAPGCKLAWNIRESLAEVESDLIDAVEASLPASADLPRESHTTSHSQAAVS